MFSFQKLFGKEDQFLGLLNEAAQAALMCTKSLSNFLEEPDTTTHLEETKRHRQLNKAACEKVGTLLVNTFVTALEREDIEALSTALYKMPKPLVKFIDRYQMGRKYIPEVKFDSQVDIAEKVTSIIVEMVKKLSEGASIETIKGLNRQIQVAEAEADHLENELLAELYANRNSAQRIIIIKDLHSLLEAAIDKARDAGNVITHIVLKNS